MAGFQPTLHGRFWVTPEGLKARFAQKLERYRAQMDGSIFITRAHFEPARLRDVSALDTFLDDLPLLFEGPIYAWFPAQAAPVLETLNHTGFGCLA